VFYGHRNEPGRNRAAIAHVPVQDSMRTIRVEE
jgi:hypothetical protein